MKTYENLRGKRVDVRGRQVRANKILFPSLLARLAFPLPSSPFSFSSCFFVRFLGANSLDTRILISIPYFYTGMEKKKKKKMKKMKKKKKKKRKEQSWEKFSILNDLRNELAERKKRDNAGIVCISIGGQLPPGRDVNRLQEPAGK